MPKSLDKLPLAKNKFQVSLVTQKATMWNVQLYLTLGSSVVTFNSSKQAEIIPASETACLKVSLISTHSFRSLTISELIWLESQFKVLFHIFFYGYSSFPIVSIGYIVGYLWIYSVTIINYVSSTYPKSIKMWVKCESCLV